MQTEMGIGIIGEDQTQITPFQRQVFEAEQARKAKAKEERMEEARGGDVGAGRQKNQMAGSGNTASSSETVRYESEGKVDDDALDVF